MIKKQACWDCDGGGWLAYLSGKVKTCPTCDGSGYSDEGEPEDEDE